MRHREKKKKLLIALTLALKSSLDEMLGRQWTHTSTRNGRNSMWIPQISGPGGAWVVSHIPAPLFSMILWQDLHHFPPEELQVCPRWEIQLGVREVQGREQLQEGFCGENILVPAALGAFPRIHWLLELWEWILNFPPRSPWPWNELNRQRVTHGENDNSVASGWGLGCLSIP